MGPGYLFSASHVFTKLKTRYLQVLNEVDGPDWYKLIIFLLPTGKGTFYDRSYDLFPDWRYGLYYHLPKHLADDHVTITPLIMDHLSDTCGYDESDRATIELNQSFQEENLKIETLIEITGEEKAEKAFGGYIKDSSIRRFIFNGRKIKFVEKPDRNWRVQSGEYKIIMTRKVKTVNDGDSVVTFEVSVISENDEFFSKKTYRIFSEKNLTVGFDFYSKDKESSMAMDYIKIFTF